MPPYAAMTPRFFVILSRAAHGWKRIIPRPTRTERLSPHRASVSRSNACTCKFVFTEWSSRDIEISGVKLLDTETKIETEEYEFPALFFLKQGGMEEVEPVGKRSSYHMSHRVCMFIGGMNSAVILSCTHE